MILKSEPTTVRELANECDVTTFRTMREYSQGNLRGIEFVALVQPGFLLEEVAAIMVHPDVEEDTFPTMLERGMVRVVVNNKDQTAPQWRKYTDTFSEIKDDMDVYVLMLTPVYLGQRYEDRLEELKKRAAIPNN